MYHDDAYVTKNQTQVYVRLASGKEFRGSVYLRHDERVTDLLNDSRDFIPLSIGGNKLSAVRKSAIEEILMDLKVVHDEYSDTYKNKTSTDFNNSFILSLPKSLAILGLKGNFTEDQLTERHRDLVNHFHPDHGGSDFITGQLNAARDFLMESLKDR